MKKVWGVLIFCMLSGSSVFGSTLVETFDYVNLSEFQSAGNWAGITTNVASHQSEITQQGDLKLHHIQPASPAGGYSLGYTRPLSNPSHDFRLYVELVHSSALSSTADIFIQLYGGGTMVFYLGCADWKTDLNRANFFLYDHDYSLFRSDTTFGYFTGNPKEITIDFERMDDALTVTVYRGIGSGKTVMLDVNLLSYIDASESMNIDIDEIRILFGGTAASADLTADFGQFNYLQMEYEGTSLIPEPFSIILLLLSLIRLGGRYIL
ncbi:MAG: hypothetical protein AB1454_12450 [Candidatus Auribacterota bacterium]